MPLASGTRLGRYEIVALLGVGGMGEVYRAKDTRLGREVAIKVLPQHLSTSESLRTRFEREARIISNLDHPHICTLFDIGRDGETDFLVMELLRGQTLSKRLAAGPLPVADVLRIGAEISDALAYAHRAAVVHRDLKPGNVMLTDVGAKLMDFGIARAEDEARTALGQTTATLSPTGGLHSAFVGTLPYMAPEQLTGNLSDSRVDLWALGCVLHEMATARRAFPGTTSESVTRAILTGSTPSTSLPGLDRVVTKCLAKNPDDRWPTADDLRRELLQLSEGKGAPTRRGRGIVAVGLVLATLTLVLLATRPWSFKGGATGLKEFRVLAPPGVTVQLPAEPAISPDGKSLLWVAMDSTGLSHVYLNVIGSQESRRIPGTSGATLPFWSPDGHFIGFFAGGELRRVERNGGDALKICDAPDGRGGAWSRNDVIVFAPQRAGPLARVNAGGGTPSNVTAVDTTRSERSHRYPQFLPDGKRFLYGAIGNENEIVTYVGSLDEVPPVEVCRGGSAGRYSDAGSILYLDIGSDVFRRRLMARQFDITNLRATGDARTVLDRVATNNIGYMNVAVGPRGMLVTQAMEAERWLLEWRDRAGKVTGVAAKDLPFVFGTPSPDLDRIAYSGFEPHDLFVRDLRSGATSRLTFENRVIARIVWCPDGRRLAFARLFDRRGYDIFARSASEDGSDSLVFQAGGFGGLPLAWSPDTRWLIVQLPSSSGHFALWRIPMDGHGKAAVFGVSTLDENAVAATSPDGRWLAYSAIENNKPLAFVESFPEPGTKYQVASKSLIAIHWKASGDGLVVTTEDREVLEIPRLANGRFGSPRLVSRLPSDVVAVWFAGAGERSLTATPQDVSTLSQLNVVLGWPALLTRRAGR